MTLDLLCDLAMLLPSPTGDGFMNNYPYRANPDSLSGFMSGEITGAGR